LGDSIHAGVNIRFIKEGLILAINFSWGGVSPACKA